MPEHGPVAPSEVLEYVDAPSFCLWLQDSYGGRQGVFDEFAKLPDKQRARWERTYFRWRYESTTISIYTIDEFFVAIGRHISELPSSLYTTKRWLVKNAFKRATGMLAEGMEVEQVAAAVNLPGQTIHSWETLRLQRIEEAFSQTT
jgi:hypothetical protein